jgi:hypothetical protein
VDVRRSRIRDLDDQDEVVELVAFRGGLRITRWMHAPAVDWGASSLQQLRNRHYRRLPGLPSLPSKIPRLLALPGAALQLLAKRRRSRKILSANKVTELFGRGDREFPKLDVEGSNPFARSFLRGLTESQAASISCKSWGVAAGCRFCPVRGRCLTQLHGLSIRIPCPCKERASTIFLRRQQSGRFSGIGIDRKDARQLLDGTSEVNSYVAVPSGQARVGVPGQFLQRSHVDSGPTAEGEVRVPQRVEVGEQRTVGPLKFGLMGVAPPIGHASNLSLQ